MPKVFAVPKEGVLVRHESGKQLDPAGESVDRTSYWLRRQRDGDVTLTTPDAATAVVETTTAEAEATAAAAASTSSKKTKA